MLVYLVLAWPSSRASCCRRSILLTVPLAWFGGLLGIQLFGGTLNIYSRIALVLLIGLAAKNGILIVEFANQLRDKGRSVKDAVLEASVLRLRPILMTGLSTSLGAVPLVLASGAGAEARQSIGIVVLAGVSLATLVTLVVLPTLYTLIGRFTSSPEERTRILAQQVRESEAAA